MAAIPCSDFITDSPVLWPARPERANPDSIANRYANFVMSLSLSPEQTDDKAVYGWNLWDIPSSHASQIDDDRGNDLVTLAVQNNIVFLDWDRTADEIDWNTFAPIHRLVRFGPLPSNARATDPEGGYDLAKMKRFREFEFNLRDEPTGSAGTWRVTVGEWEREGQTERTTTRLTSPRMRTRIAVRGRSFVVTLEHTSDEAVTIEHWRAAWDVVGRRIRQAAAV